MVETASFYFRLSDEQAKSIFNLIPLQCFDKSVE